jgi:hypothetical protein
MIFIDCGNGNPDDYDSEFAKELQTMLDELSEEDTHTET